MFRVPCVKQVKAEDNGGATSRGVTRDSIKLVMVTAADPNSVPKDPSIAAQNGVNQATGTTGIYADAVRDANELYASVYETYGRDLDIEIYTRTGIDEASMRADALAIAEKKPFAVLNAEPLVGQLLADRKIISIDFPRDPKAVAQQAPYRWSYGTDYFALTLMAAEVLGKQLWDGKAEWAGDESMHAKDRKFGLVYPDSNDAIPYPDLALFEKTVKKFGGGTITTKVAYTGATGADTASIDTLNQQAATPIIARLKDAGVTTVVLITSQSMTKALTLAATKQEYRPEWFCAEWFNCSFDFYRAPERPGAVGARLRYRLAVPGARRRGARQLRQAVPVVLRPEPGHTVVGRPVVPQQLLLRDPHGGTQTHAADVPGRAVLQAADGRRQRRRGLHGRQRLRAEKGHGVPRLLVVGHRREPVVVEP